MLLPSSLLLLPSLLLAALCSYCCCCCCCWCSCWGVGGWVGLLCCAFCFATHTQIEAHTWPASAHSPSADYIYSFSIFFSVILFWGWLLAVGSAAAAAAAADAAALDTSVFSLCHGFMINLKSYIETLTSSSPLSLPSVQPVEPFADPLSALTKHVSRRFINTNKYI